jgi:AGZA family xanthine/uracil permease-like MFS transporter
MLEKLFKLKANKTTVKTEVIAGFATFMTMAYIISLNPSIIANRITNGASDELWNAAFLATILSSAAGTLIMAFLANKPFALAPGMGLNTYFTAIVVSIVAATGLSYDEAYQGGLAIILVSGILFTVLTLMSIREKIVEAIPLGVRHGITAGIGLMLVYIGVGSNAQVFNADFSQSFTIIKFFTLGPNDTYDMMNSAGASYGKLILYVLTFFVGLFTIVILNHKKVKGSILFGMFTASILYFVGEAVFLNTNPFASLEGANFLPAFDDLANKTLFKFNFGILFELGTITSVMAIISFCMVDMFDTIGTLLGTASRAGMLDKDGKMENMNKAMLSDSVATMVGASTGTSTVTAFIESAAGVQEGGRTGLTSVVTGLSLLACMFLAPIAGLIPAPATSAALVFVGVLMLGALKNLNYDDFSHTVPVVLMLVFMMITGGIGNGIGVGLISYSIIKLCTGKVKEISFLTIFLSLLYVVKFFLLY